jgi:hypothetical protein
MSKINYRVCDICGNRIPGFEFDITGIAKRYINGCRIWNKLFNRLDVCDDCIDKIKRLSIDKKDEEKYIKEVFDKAKDYDNLDMKSAYYEGIEDALGVLSHKRLKNIKIK